jgi:hypothetical protein
LGTKGFFGKCRKPAPEEQQAFIEHLKRRGVPHHIARSYEDAVAKLREWEVLCR